MNVKIVDLLRTSRLGSNQKKSKHHYLQALQRVAGLESQTFLKKKPSLLYNLRTDQVAAHLGLGCLDRDQKLDQEAVKHLAKAHYLTQELTTIEDSPGQQDRLGVILTIQREIFNTPQQATPEDRRRALVKQQMAVAIFRQTDYYRAVEKTNTPQTYGSITIHGRHTREARTLQRIPICNAGFPNYRKKSADPKQRKLHTPASTNICQH